MYVQLTLRRVRVTIFTVDKQYVINYNIEWL